MTIRYQNINDEDVAIEQLSNLREYHKVFSENQVILKKEFYIDNTLKHIDHYKNNIESEDDDMITLQNLLGLSSNEMQYYLNATLEPQK